MVCCVLWAGCGSFGKKTPSKEPSGQPADAARPPADGAGSTERTAPISVGGLLAGRVLDSYDRPPPPTYIQVLPAQDSQVKAQALDVATDNQGYVTIQGLQPGQHYQLSARTRDEPK